MAIAGFPDAKSAGFPDGVILTASGDVNVTKAGTVINALDVKGTIWIMADNVTVQNSRITSTDWTGIWIKPGVTGTVVKDNEILNVGSSKDGANGIFGSGTFLRNDIHDVENGINVTGTSLIQDNYIHDMNAPNVRIGTVWGGPHYDGIEINGGVSDVVIRHNTIINDNGQTSAVMINNDFGPVSNVKVDGNFLAGGGYTLYSDGSFSSTDKISGVEFTNNELGQGHWGYYYFKGNTPLLSNNDELGTNWPAPDSTDGTPTNSQPGAPTISSFSNDTGVVGDGITSDNSIQLKGMAAADSTVKVYDGSTLLGTTKASSTGSWEYITAVLKDANHVLTATATTSGQVGAASSALTVTVDTAAPIKPVMNSNTIVNTNHVKLSGTAEANTKITVYDGNIAVGTGTTSSIGAWSITTNALSAGTHTLTTKATDAAGNTGAVSTALAVTIAPSTPTTPTTPNAPTIASFSRDSGKVGDFITSDNTLTLKGTSAANSTVTLYDKGGKIGTTTSDSTGAWSFKTATLTDGAHNLTAKATDSHGKTGPASSTLAVTVDTHAPNAPTLGVFSDSGKAVRGTTTADDFLLKGAAEANSTIKVFDAGKQIGTATTKADGTWSFDTGHLADGKHSFTSSAVDAAGNTSAVSSAKGVTVIDAPTTVSADVSITDVQQSSSNSTVIKGAADAYSQVKIYDGSKAIGSVTSDSDGSWSFTTYSSSHVVNSFSAKQLDHTGNAVASSGSAITGTCGANTLVGTSGDDLFIGKGHSDTFVFAPNFGNDVIKDFKASGWGHDTVQFSKSVFDNFADVLAHATQAGHDVVIAANANDSLTLKNIKLSAITSNDFHFS